MKCLYSAMRSLDLKGSGQTRWAVPWKSALDAFAITFADRMPAAENHLSEDATYTVRRTDPGGTVKQGVLPGRRADVRSEGRCRDVDTGCCDCREEGTGPSAEEAAVKELVRQARRGSRRRACRRR
jgi:hypothetical protein